MFDFGSLMNRKPTLTPDQVADILSTTPAALKKFEEAYSLLQDPHPIFDRNYAEPTAEAEELTKRIVKELVESTSSFSYQRNSALSSFHPALPLSSPFVTNEEIMAVQERDPSFHPQCTASLLSKDVNGDSADALLFYYQMAIKKPKKAKEAYHHFRQGLDILDLDPVLYTMLGENKNSMGYWFPKLVDAVKASSFLIPSTTICKVPMPLLQLTRKDYETVTPTSKKIVDDWAKEVFRLDPYNKYFAKTGIFSNKFDFRNCRVEGNEVNDLGEYLLYIHYYATMLASPLNVPSIYGAATTNEWVVREWIDDVESNPCIYHGMPLHTEYRAFVDCDTKEVLSIAPYWDPETMKKRFSTGPDSVAADMKHDYVIYKAHENVLMQRYAANKDHVLEEIKKILSFLSLSGQWSIDVMQNGTDFWIIDMATAATSAFCESIPEEKRKKEGLEWFIPKLTDME